MTISSLFLGLAFAAGAAAPAAKPDPSVILVDIGSGSDAPYVKRGFYQREGLNPKSRHEYYRTCTFRWASNHFVMRLPVFPEQDNEVIIRTFMGRRRVKLSVAGWETVVKGTGEPCECRFTLPQAVVGKRRSVLLAGTALDPYRKPARARDRRELAAAVDWVKVRATKPLEIKQVDLGAPGDESAVVKGLYGREGPYPKARLEFAKSCTFRWATNEFALRLPVYAKRRNTILFRVYAGPRILRFSCGDWSARMFLAGPSRNEYRLVVPAEAIGDKSEIVLRCVALTPAKPNPKRPKARLLMAILDWVRIRPALEDEVMPELDPFAPADHAVPVTLRLRGVEARPATADLDSYMTFMVEGGATAATIGPLNGLVQAAYPSKLAPAHPRMEPDFLPRLIQRLHDAGMAAIAWVPFNVQDLRRIEDYQPIKRFPQWAMKFIEDPSLKDRPRVGMCVVSSPYRDHHAKLLAEVAGFDIDAYFFDGFYLGGIPHPVAPGCVCEFCTRRFKADTGLTAPARVDWTDAAFKRWVRWRNHKLIETASFFRDALQGVKPGVPVTMNTNQWPFGSKDWDTAIPLWRITEFGVSQHAYSMQPEMEWLMLGYKCRLSKDMNPKHADVWRPAGAKYARGGPERYEHAMLTFMLSALSHGVVPWHGGHMSPLDAQVRVHQAVAKREPYFSRDEIQHAAVWISQNTHDFWGHQPGTDHLMDYRDTVLGNWLVLTRGHVPFQFVFDNMVEAGELDGFKVLVAPNVAAMSGAAAQRLQRWVRQGGRLIATGEFSTCGEWGDRLPEPRLAHMFGPRTGMPKEAASRALGKGIVHYLPRDPGLAYVRDRDRHAVQQLIKAVCETPLPIEVEAPPSLVANTFFSPDRKALWVHLLNVSAYMPNRDTGFRGCERPPKFVKDTASDAQISGSDETAAGEHKPVRNIVVRPRAWQVKSARLAVTDRDLAVDASGRVTVPELDVHDVLVLKLK